MTFKAEEVGSFLEVFNESKNKIRGFEGCQHLELHRDYNQDNIFSTYSHWVDEQALNNYRQSELFNEVWAKTKVLFADKPMAFSSKQYIIVE